MKLKLITRWIPVALLTLMAGHSFAAKLGTPQVLMYQNEKVSIDIPIELGAGEQLVRVGVANERVYGALGMSFPQSLRAAVVSIRDRQGNPVIHLAGGVPKGDALPVVLEIDTSSGQAVRQFVAAIPAKAKSVAAPEAATPKVVKSAVATAVGAATSHSAELVRQNIDAAFDVRMTAINDSIARVAEGIKEVTAEFKRDNQARERQVAALMAMVPPPKQETPWLDDLTMMGGAAILGISLAAAWFVGSRPKLPVGTSVFLVGPGRTPIEGKFVRVTSASYGKPLPYRLADMLTGAPKRIELVWSEDEVSKERSVETLAAEPLAHALDVDSLNTVRPFPRREIDMAQHSMGGPRNAL